jgi:hypothetical protein
MAPCRDVDGYVRYLALGTRAVVGGDFGNWHFSDLERTLREGPLLREKRTFTDLSGFVRV